MQYAMEIPLKHIEELSELTDFDFALAHHALQYGPNSKYCKFYKAQAKKDRVVWLDNSYYELQEALSNEDILKAAKWVGATHVVAHEVRDDPYVTLEHVMDMKEEVARKGLPYSVVGAWQGYYKDLLALMRICDEVALPFSRQRHRVVSNPVGVKKSGTVNCTEVHYFGFRNLDELRRCPPKSLDTSAPIKCAIQGIDIAYRTRRPKMGPLDMDLKIDKETMKLVKLNIRRIRDASEGA